MEVITTKELLDRFDGNKTKISEFCNLNRGTAIRRLAQNAIVVIDGEVYVKYGKINPSVENEPRTRRFNQYIDLVQSVLSQTRSVRETAELMSESKEAKKWQAERDGWQKRISAWLYEGKLVL